MILSLAAMIGRALPLLNWAIYFYSLEVRWRPVGRGGVLLLGRRKALKRSAGVLSGLWMAKTGRRLCRWGRPLLMSARPFFSPPRPRRARFGVQSIIHYATGDDGDGLEDWLDAIHTAGIAGREDTLGHDRAALG